MTEKDLKLIKRRDLIEIISTMKKNELELMKRLEDTERKLADVMQNNVVENTAAPAPIVTPAPIPAAPQIVMSTPESFSASDVKPQPEPFIVPPVSKPEPVKDVKSESTETDIGAKSFNAMFEAAQAAANAAYQNALEIANAEAEKKISQTKAECDRLIAEAEEYSSICIEAANKYCDTILLASKDIANKRSKR